MSRTTKYPLHGPRLSRWVRGVGYPHVRPGESDTNIIEIKLSKQTLDDRLHYEDNAVALHEKDIYSRNLTGLPIFRMHDKTIGELGDLKYAFINNKSQLDVSGYVHSLDLNGNPSPEGMRAIQDIDNGVIDGFSINFGAVVNMDTQEVYDKKFFEISLTERGEAHYGDCQISCIASKKQTTNDISYSNSNMEIKSKITEKTGYCNTWANSYIMDQNNSQTQNANTTPAATTQAAVPQQQSQQQQRSNIAPEVFTDLTNELKNKDIQAKADAETRKNMEAKASAMEKELAGYRKEKEERIKQEEAKTLSELKPTMDMLAKFGGLKEDLKKETALMMAQNWVHKNGAQMQILTKNVAQALNTMSTENAALKEQLAGFGVQARQALVAVEASKGRTLVNLLQDDQRRVGLRDQKRSGVAFDDVYQQPDLLDRYNLWNPTEVSSHRSSFGNAGSQIVDDVSQPHQSHTFGGNTQMIEMPASKNRQPSPALNAYTPHALGGFTNSLNRNARDRSNFNEAANMTQSMAKSLCTVTTRKGEFLAQRGDPVF